MLTTFSDDEDVLAALRAGARGYLTKDAGAEELTRAISRVAAGHADLDPGVQRRLLDMLPAETSLAVAPPDARTERGIDVLRLIGEGLSNREIPAYLQVSPGYPPAGERSAEPRVSVSEPHLRLASSGGP